MGLDRILLICPSGKIRLIYTSANALIEIDNFAPIQPGIDIADRTANRAAEMGPNVLPIPIRQILQPELAAVAAKFVPLWWPHAIDQHSLKARIAIDGTIPITKRARRFSAPRHSRMKAPSQVSDK
jgi:hypothetical protein